MADPKRYTSHTTYNGKPWRATVKHVIGQMGSEVSFKFGHINGLLQVGEFHDRYILYREYNFVQPNRNIEGQMPMLVIEGGKHYAFYMIDKTNCGVTGKLVHDVLSHLKITPFICTMGEMRKLAAFGAVGVVMDKQVKRSDWDVVFGTTSSMGISTTKRRRT